LFAAPCARAGDPGALEFLHAQANSAERWQRELAVMAFVCAGLEDDVARSVRDDPDASVRKRAVLALSMNELAPRHVAELRGALNAGDVELSDVALQALTRIGDAGALDAAIAMLEQPDPQAVARGMAALTDAMQHDTALAQRVFDVLVRRYQPEAHLELAHKLQYLKAIAQVPLGAATELLYELSTSSEGEISGMPAARWLLQEAGNTCEAGQRVLRAKLAAESDPARRLDLIEAVCVRGGPFALQAMLEVLEDPATGPYELVFAAERASILGRVEQVAPVLKRVALRVTQPDVRTALQSFLWANYPGPR
jgi:hypothetical protein